MSHPELAYAMTNDEFDILPRWSQPQDSLSSSQAAHASAQSSYLYPSGPPPPPPNANRLPPIQQTPGRQPRVSHLQDEDMSYSSTNSLARSASLNNTTNRARRRVHDDLEGAFHTDQQAPLDNSYYQSPSGYAPSSAPSAQPSADGYGDGYFPSNSLHTPKRSQTTRDPPSSARSARSPLRSDVLLDPYSPQSQATQQAGPYSPTTASYPYDANRVPSNPYSPAHSRSQSRAKMQADPSQSAYAGYAMDTSTSPQPPSQQGHLTAYGHSPHHSLSTPSSPLGHPSFHNQYYPQDPQAMLVEPPPKRRVDGFRRVRDARDLRPYVNPQPSGRRMDATGVYLSPLRALTTDIIDSYRLCNSAFKYESSHNPRRVLTKPSKAVHNDGYDNDDYDYILYVNDCLGVDDNRYLILDILGQGTFGQVVKCQNIKSHEIVAVKVVKNKPAYFNQSMMEVTILELLNNQCDPHDEHHILRLRDSFIHKNHLCLVFELLSSNLYELIKQNQFQGLSTQLVKVFTAQLLDSLTVLKEARLIHCDLKPENILLKSLQSPQIKVIDFGSACHERQTVYTYIQSRFYRSPEVLLGIPYTAAIDMWSLGCIAVELFLGLPLFPGTSEYNQITRIVEMLGLPPEHMMAQGKQTNQFFDSYMDHYGQKKYKLKSLEQYSREHNTNEQPGKQYFKHNTLPEIINSAPMPAFKSSRAGHETEKELNSRASFIDFCQGLLNMDPIKRWSPQQARLHPFITGEKWTKPWSPMQAQQSADPQMPTPAPSAGPDPKRPYGGLVPSQPKGTQPYTDAATYNERLRQHQVHTAQAAASQQAASNAVRNPYISPPASNAPSTGSYGPNEYAAGYVPQPPAGQYPASQSVPATHRTLHHQGSHGNLHVNTSVPPYASHQTAGGMPNLRPGPTGAPNASANPNPPIDNIPPALARLQHMNHDVIGGRNALTPVMNRGDDAIREWERRQAGKATTAQPYPELQYLHQQAELAAAGGLNWPQAQAQARYHPPAPSKLAQGAYGPPPPIVNVMDDEHQRRDAVMSNVRSAARGDAYAGPAAIASPPQAYNSAGARGYQGGYPGGAQPGFEGGVYVPMQPEQYQAAAYAGGNGVAQGARAAQPGVMPGFYGPPAPAQAQQGAGKDSNRNSGMDIWPR